MTTQVSPPLKWARHTVKSHVECSVLPTITRRLKDILHSQKPPTVKEVQMLCEFYRGTAAMYLYALLI